MRARHLALVAAALLTVSSARADDNNPAAAEDLFQRAKVLMVRGQFGDACPLLAESYRLDPAGGTLQNLAVCLESSGKWASAYARFQELRTVSKQANPPRADRVKLADEHLTRVAPKISHLLIQVPAEVAAAAVVQVDGVTFGRAAWSAGIAADPGSHELVVSATGKRPYEAKVTVPVDATEQTVPIPPLSDIPTPVATALADDRHASDERDERLERERSLRRTGYFVGGAGLAVVGAGLVFGALTIKNSNDAKNACNVGAGGGHGNADIDPSGHCYSHTPTLDQANQSTNHARTFANVANVLVPLGAVGIGVGIYVVLIVPRAAASKGPSPFAFRAGPSLGGGVIEGVF